MNEIGFKLSLPGYDVKTATPEQCSVHSDFATLLAKLDKTPTHIATVTVDFTGTVTQGVTHTLYAISHGYNYTPLCIPSIVFRDQPSGVLFSSVGHLGIGTGLVINAYCTSTQFLITIFDQFNWTNSNAELEVSYHIFAHDVS
jgi:hypothetical protein